MVTKTESILLTAAKIWDLVGELKTTYEEDLMLVAKAQLKKVVELLKEHGETVAGYRIGRSVPNGNSDLESYPSSFDISLDIETWQALLKETE